MAEDIFHRNKSISPVEMSDMSKKPVEGDKREENKSRLWSFLKSNEEHLKKFFETSLITSFPKIAASSSWKKRIWKSLIFVLCFVGLLCQTCTFLQFYFTYPTTVNLKFSSPYEIVQPALTLCSNNLISRPVYCEKSHAKCEFQGDEQLFCSQYPKYCGPGGNVSYKGVPTERDFQTAKLNNSWEEADALAPKHGMIQECKKVINGQDIQCNIRRFPFVTKKRKATFCYTIDSLLGQPHAKDDIYPNTLYFSVELNTFPEDYFSHSEPVFIYAVIHDRKHLVNPFLDGFILNGGYRYMSYVSMTEIIRLPYPYNTNCTDYIKLWRENNGTGPLDEMTCIEHCKLNKLKAKNDCIDEYISYSPHQEELCAFGIEKTNSDIVKDCGMECQPACQEQTYEVKYDEIEPDDDPCNSEDEYCKTSHIYLRVSFRKFRLTSHIYQPQYKIWMTVKTNGGSCKIWFPQLQFLVTLPYISNVSTC
ncbi:uncharacterized protein [Parasteatoda tepidariorum]|uniref:uncharacterized protein isoform X2 n=1 Tax=Parasteatoda tepidariorum TaxID=114398 RepID=UPI0039BD0254